ncbi:MAG: right-handed parallel beta-helix repeat-containing protein [Methanomicrobiales archaeon]|nr:right-handed parallel beta-helix repeat-containing protein [Methanomicrobiales archaeon]
MRRKLQFFGILLLISLAILGLVRSYTILHPLDLRFGSNSSLGITLEPLANLSVPAGEIVQFTVTGTDARGESLRYHASPLPLGAQMNEVTGTFRWMPVANQSGTHWITFSATDGQSTAEELVSISVIHRNRPPVLDPVGDLKVLAGQRVEVAVHGSDPDGDPLIYSLGTLYPGASFDNRTGVLVWQVPADLYGTGMLAVTAWDGWDSAQEIISITILRPDRVGMPRERPLQELLGYLPEEELAATLRDPSRQIHVVSPSAGPELQDRINGASPGDIILVYPGTYFGGLTVDRSLVLLGLDTPVLDARGSGSVLSLTAGDTTVAGFTLLHSGNGTYDGGVKISSSGNRIEKNVISGHRYGVYLLPLSDGNVIRNNTITNSSGEGIHGENLRDKTVIDSNLILNHAGDGIHIEYSRNVSLRNNTVAYNGRNGVTLNYSLETRLAGNRVESNREDGVSIFSGLRDIIRGNTFSLNGNNGLSLMHSQDPDLLGIQIEEYTPSEFLNRVSNNTCAGNGRAGITLREVSAIVSGNDLRFNGYGIWVLASAARITDNHASRNHVGILLTSTESNALWWNEALGNEYGFWLEGRSRYNVLSTNNASLNRQYGYLLGPDTEDNVLRENLGAENSIACIADEGKNQVVVTRDCRTGEVIPS